MALILVPETRSGDDDVSTELYVRIGKIRVISTHNWRRGTEQSRVTWRQHHRAISYKRSNPQAAMQPRARTRVSHRARPGGLE